MYSDAKNQCCDKYVPLSGPVLQEKAQQFIVSLGYANMCASSGWLQIFKESYEIVLKYVAKVYV